MQQRTHMVEERYLGLGGTPSAVISSNPHAHWWALKSRQTQSRKSGCSVGFLNSEFNTAYYDQEDTKPAGERDPVKVEGE